MIEVSYWFNDTCIYLYNEPGYIKESEIIIEPEFYKISDNEWILLYIEPLINYTPIKYNFGDVMKRIITYEAD